MSLGPQNQYADDVLIQMTVEDALASSERMPLDDFIVQTQKMAFNVRTLSFITLL
jgi:hypothetical protein